MSGRPGARAGGGVVADAVRRAVDVVGAGVALVLCSPLLATVSLLVRVTMGPPVLFRQQRSGHHGQPFDLLKFRTMRTPGPGEDDPALDGARLTPLGRWLRAWSIDELPGLWNVVRGELGFVGPRPLPVRYLERYDDRQRTRLEVRPGITGWAQVNGRNATSWDERFELDAWYVEHRSLPLDARILGRTVQRVLRRDGVAHDGYATMPEFAGSTVGR